MPFASQKIITQTIIFLINFFKKELGIHIQLKEETYAGIGNPKGRNK